MTTPINGALPPPKQIRFVNNQGQPPSKRRRINAACLTCRKRKTRCAGEKPDCSTCKKNGHVCLGYTDFVERRREDRREDGLVILKTEPADAPNLNNATSNDYPEDDDDELEHRRWVSKAAPRTAGFVDQDTMSRTDSRSSTTITSSRPHEPSNDWDQDTKSQGPPKTIRRSVGARNTSYSEDSRSSNSQLERHRVPYFRYFGPTAIVPGFKQMVVNVYRDSRRKSRGNSFSTTSPGSQFNNRGIHHSDALHHEATLETLEDLPVYDVNSSGPAHPLIISLAETFFVHLGCNYRFLHKDRFLRALKEKRIEPILVDAVCALAARFSDQPIFTNDHDGKMKRSEYGHVLTQRAKAAIVDTFPCPSVAAVQACLLMAYECFGADQDSALWMYLGIAIRMAVDLGLQKMEGVKYQGERDPWYTRTDDPDNKHDDEESLSPEEQQEVEQERIDTFWAVFVLDRVISSGTGRPVTFRDDDYELSLPPATVDPVSNWPDPFPPFIEIIHLYGRASDVLNNIRNANDLTDEKMHKLKIMERDLTAIYQKQHQRLHFNAVNFREYVNANQGTTFMLLHFWFHALVIILHQPTLLTPFNDLSPTQLLANSPELPNSRELSMSSAKTIADILAFAELIDPKSLIGNPFTSQPIYIAACAFLMESVANTSQPPSRENSPTPEARANHFRPPIERYNSSHDTRPMKHSLLASAANRNYQRCYKSLQQLEEYWSGVGYILTALDQKSKGIWDCETFTSEEYEAMKMARRGPLARLSRFEHPSSPNVPPIAYSLTGTTNSPNSNLTVLFQGNLAAQPGAPASATSAPAPPPTHVPVSAATPPGNMIYDPIRQSLPETPPAFPPAYLQPNVSAVRYQPHPSKAHRLSQSPAIGKSMLKYESPSPGDMDQGSPHSDSKSHMYGPMSRSNQTPLHHSSYHHAPQHHATYDSLPHDRSPSSTPTDSGMGHQHASHNLQNGHNHNHDHNHDNGVDHDNPHHSGYEADFAQSGLVSGSYSYMGLNPINDFITFNSQEVNFDMLGLHSEMMPPWLEILPGDVLGGLFEGGMMGAGQHMG
ncbi:fungal-specific transcription factor domain-containing protein [Chaetomidium leptoderma]|uniref:Fungal-specific transcription factor domain-containing protein n=1 Tax=Chaetomidium leptoderma TaxID=669021 RepID=A0AAN6VCE9_9PEZI|nr:fungal-specific transcription factor domain-containing protein [Chaetomidium leptoderma]